ncbi:MAG: cupin domain-containing protein [Desulfobacteraceae bacterium]|jgi:quercetin dioxygenase-like cupin family protein|nr:MAG: cupin domain-containing protein [Desulfobacteraceae bacterium]
MKPVNLSDIEPRDVVPGFKARFVHSSTMTLAFWDAKAGNELSSHSHPHEQIAHVIEGEFKFILAGKAMMMKAGDLLVVPPHAVHSGQAVTDCRLLDIFHPVREDYRKNG